MYIAVIPSNKPGTDTGLLVIGLPRAAYKLIGSRTSKALEDAATIDLGRGARYLAKSSHPEDWMVSIIVADTSDELLAKCQKNFTDSGFRPDMIENVNMDLHPDYEPET